jgi:type IV pilus assembly protein PilE
MNQRTRGFTLIELVVTVAIVALIMAIAVPSYRAYVLRANRADATTALLRLAAAQERFYLQNNRYADNTLLDDAPPAGLGFTATERGLYNVTLAVNGGGWQNGYILTATANSTGRQTDDTACRAFTVNEQGNRTAADSSGTTNATITAT